MAISDCPADAIDYIVYLLHSEFVFCKAALPDDEHDFLKDFYFCDC